MKRLMIVVLFIAGSVNAADKPKTVYCTTSDSQIVSVTRIKKTGIYVSSTTADSVKIIAARLKPNLYEVLSTTGGNYGKVNNDWPSDVYFNGDSVEISQGNHSLLYATGCKESDI